MNNRLLEPGSWSILDTRYLYRHPWLTMRRDRVRLPNGQIIDDYYVWEYPPWINVLATTPENLVILIRQYRHGIGKIFYELPAGVHDKPEESLLEAAQRELFEETGFGGGSWNVWMELSANPALQNNLTCTFLAENVRYKGSRNLDPTEEISVHPVTIDALRAIVLDGEMMQALHVAPILKYLLLHHG